MLLASSRVLSQTSLNKVILHAGWRYSWPRALENGRQSQGHLGLGRQASARSSEETEEVFGSLYWLLNIHMKVIFLADCVGEILKRVCCGICGLRKVVMKKS